MKREDNEYSVFYDENRDKSYLSNHKNLDATQISSYPSLKAFIERFGLYNRKCLEIGSSYGFFQDMVNDYTGTDIAGNLEEYYHKNYKVAIGNKYPFSDEEFDAIWSFNVFEHIPHLQDALSEINRLLKPGGLVLFQPAWYCRPWSSEGYAVRPFSDFPIKGKLVKLSIPLRENIVFRSLQIFPKRLIRQVLFYFGIRYKFILYRKLEPNYQIYWTSDSDACNSIDPHDAILWFLSNGFDCLSHHTFWEVLSVRTGGLIFRKTN